MIGAYLYLLLICQRVTSLRVLHPFCFHSASTLLPHSSHNDRAMPIYGWARRSSAEAEYIAHGPGWDSIHLSGYATTTISYVVYFRQS